eukprot:6490724-Amphidinium_carterae.1
MMSLSVELRWDGLCSVSLPHALLKDDLDAVCQLSRQSPGPYLGLVSSSAMELYWMMMMVTLKSSKTFNELGIATP